MSFLVLVCGSLIGILTLPTRRHRVGRVCVAASFGVLAFWFGAPLLGEVL
ncbi:MAG: hypothetical protein ACYS0E_19985 [Planctomycetota bacterium]